MDLKAVTLEDAEFLYELLKQREGRVNISHRSIPTLTEHRDYIENHSYQSWDIILVDNNKVGNIYLTQRDEIGIFLDKKFQGRGYGSQALKQFMKKNGKKLKGKKLFIPMPDKTIEVTVSDTVFLDKEGDRLNA